MDMLTAVTVTLMTITIIVLLTAIIQMNIQ